MLKNCQKRIPNGIQEKFEEIRNSEELDRALSDGAERANAIAEQTMKRVRDHFGLGR